MQEALQFFLISIAIHSGLQVLFGENVCENERIRSRWGGGGRAGGAPWIGQWFNTKLRPSPKTDYLICFILLIGSKLSTITFSRKNDILIADNTFNY